MLLAKDVLLKSNSTFSSTYFKAFTFQSVSLVKAFCLLIRWLYFTFR